MTGSEHKWYVVYTKPRWEKKVNELLEKKGFNAYCPLNKVKKKWSDRFKWVEEPLFKSYVFVKIDPEWQSSVRQINGVVNFVYWLGRPAIVKEQEIETIRFFLNEYAEVKAEPVALETDNKVIVRRGAFMDKRAKILKIVNNKVRVLIEGIGFALVAVIDKANIKKLE